MTIQRFNIVGTSGTGKTTFGKKLSELTGYPFIELDSLFWKPDWQESSDEEFFTRIENELDKPCWIVDGNYFRSMPIRLKKVEAIIWLDYSFAVNLYRCLKRAVSRSITRKELWPGTGNRESFRKSFLSRDSIILWTLTTHHKNRKRYLQLMNDKEHQHIEFIHLKSPREAEQFLSQLAENSSEG